MRRLMSIPMIRRFLSRQDGATAIEYAMIASGISLAIIVSISTLGTQVKTTLYDKLAALF